MSTPQTQALLADLKSALILAHGLDGTPDPYVALTAANQALTTAQQDLTTRTTERDALQTKLNTARAALPALQTALA